MSVPDKKEGNEAFLRMPHFCRRKRHTVTVSDTLGLPIGQGAADPITAGYLCPNLKDKDVQGPGRIWFFGRFFSLEFMIPITANAVTG